MANEVKGIRGISELRKDAETNHSNAKNNVPIETGGTFNTRAFFNVVWMVGIIYLISVYIGKKPAMYLSFLILVGALVVNSDKISNLLK